MVFISDALLALATWAASHWVPHATGRCHRATQRHVRQWWGSESARISSTWLLPRAARLGCIVRGTAFRRVVRGLMATNAGMNARRSMNYSVEVRDLGPIQSGSIEIHPLTLLTGDNNTGKSHLVRAICAAHWCQSAYWDRTRRASHSQTAVRVLSIDEAEELMPQVRTWGAGRSRSISLPTSLAGRYAKEVSDSLRACRSHPDLLLETTHLFSVSQHGRLSARCGTSAGPSISLVSPALGDRPLLSSDPSALLGAKELVAAVKTALHSPIPIRPSEASMRELDAIPNDWPKRVDGPIKLPLLLENAITERLNVIIPFATGVHLIDPLRQPISFSLHEFGGEQLESNGAMPQWTLEDPECESDGPLLSAMQRLRQMIGGDIRTQPADDSALEHISDYGRISTPLPAASGLVRSLAPLYLLLKHKLSGGDLLAVENADAHLAPAAAGLLAQALIDVANAGVRVVCVTHSPLVMSEVSNAMLRHRARTVGPDSAPAISPSDVAAYRCHREAPDAPAAVVRLPIENDDSALEADFTKALAPLDVEAEALAAQARVHEFGSGPKIKQIIKALVALGGEKSEGEPTHIDVHPDHGTILTVPFDTSRTWHGRNRTTTTACQFTDPHAVGTAARGWVDTHELLRLLRAAPPADKRLLGLGVLDVEQVNPDDVYEYSPYRSLVVRAPWGQEIIGSDGKHEDSPALTLAFGFRRATMRRQPPGMIADDLDAIRSVASAAHQNLGMGPDDPCIVRLADDKQVVCAGAHRMYGAQVSVVAADAPSEEVCLWARSVMVWGSAAAACLPAEDCPAGVRRGDFVLQGGSEFEFDTAYGTGHTALVKSWWRFRGDEPEKQTHGEAVEIVAGNVRLVSTLAASRDRSLPTPADQFASAFVVPATAADILIGTLREHVRSTRTTKDVWHSKVVTLEPLPNGHIMWGFSAWIPGDTRGEGHYEPQGGGELDGDNIQPGQDTTISVGTVTYPAPQFIKALEHANSQESGVLIAEVGEKTPVTLKAGGMKGHRVAMVTPTDLSVATTRPPQR